jgi:hypothetical protein
MLESPAASRCHPRDTANAFFQRPLKRNSNDTMEDCQLLVGSIGPLPALDFRVPIAKTRHLSFLLRYDMNHSDGKN